jgi:hypothetical protein
MTFVPTAAEGDEIKRLGAIHALPLWLSAIDQPGNLLPLIWRGIFPSVGRHRTPEGRQDEKHQPPAVGTSQ